MLSTKQKELMGEDDASTTLSVGTIRSGKTYSSALKFGLYTQGLEKAYTHIIGGRKLRVIESEILPALRQVADICMAPFSYTKFDNTLRIGIQKYILAAGNDTKSPDLVMGLTAHSIMVDEATQVPEEFFDAIMSRMSIAESRAWITCNPSFPLHYLKSKWIEEGRIDKVFEFTFEDNPTLSEKVKERYRQMFSGVFAARMLDGLWSLGEGLVYPDYTMTDEYPELEQRLRTDIGIDYGTASTTAIVALATLKGGQMMIVDELEIKGGSELNNKTDKEICELLVPFAEKHEARQIIMDPSAASLRAELRQVKKRRFTITKGDNNVLPGIRKTMNSLKHGKVLIHKSCECLRQELQSYVWDTKKADTVVKANDHFCDAMRYVVVSKVKGDFTRNPTLPEGM